MRGIGKKRIDCRKVHPQPSAAIGQGWNMVGAGMVSVSSVRETQDASRSPSRRACKAQGCEA